MKVQMKRTVLCIALGAMGFASLPVWADDSAALKQAIEKMTREIEALKARQQALENKPAATTAVPATADGARVVTEGAIPGSFKLPGTNVSLKIGGYVDLTMKKEFGPSMGGGSFLFAPLMTLPGSATEARHGQFYVTAKRTQANLTALVPTQLGELKAYFEGDFYGAGGNEVGTNSSSFRLRLAHASLGPVRIGQDYSTFSTDGSALIDTLDMIYGAGVSGAPRQALARYTFDIKPGHQFALAAENPEADIFGVAPATNTAGLTPVPGQTLDTMPDFVAKYTARGNWGTVSVAGVTRKLTLNNKGAAAVGGFTGEQSVTASGLMLGGMFKTFGNDSIQFHLLAGNGLGRYLQNNVASSAFVDPDDRRLKTIYSKGASIGYKHWWSPTLRSSIGLMANRANYRHSLAAGGIPLSQLKDVNMGIVNLIWTPTPSNMVGIEWNRVKVIADGVVGTITSNSNTANSLQLSYRHMF